MKEAIINEIKRILGTEPKDIWYNDEHYQEWEFGECIPIIILKEYLLGEGYKEDENTDVWETNGLDCYWYNLISPDGHKCCVKENTYYGQLKLCIKRRYSNIFYVARDEDGKLKLYKNKPIRNKTCKGCWGCHDVDLAMIIDEESFPDLSWNDDPEEVCLCLNNERYHTVKVEELDRLYEIDWNYSDMKETLETFEDRIQRYNSLPWYKRIFEKV